MKKIKKNPLKTILTISMGFLVIYFFTKYEISLWISAFIGLIGLFSEKARNLIDYLWFKLAYILSLIVPNVLLSAIFFFILFPFALLSKLFRQKDNDLLMLKKNTNSTFNMVNKSFERKNFENIW